jgi:hypothetical protein
MFPYAPAAGRDHRPQARMEFLPTLAASYLALFGAFCAFLGLFLLCVLSRLLLSVSYLAPMDLALGCCVQPFPTSPHLPTLATSDKSRQSPTVPQGNVC